MASCMRDHIIRYFPLAERARSPPAGARRLPAGGEKAVGVVFCVLFIQRGRGAKLRSELI
jgi:hypothetical protein